VKLGLGIPGNLAMPADLICDGYARTVVGGLTVGQTDEAANRNVGALYVSTRV